MHKRIQKIKDLRPPPRMSGQAAAEGRQNAIGHRTRGDGDRAMAHLDTGALGSVVQDDKIRSFSEASWQRKKYEDGPHYSWLKASQPRSPSSPPKQAWCTTEPSMPRHSPTSIREAPIPSNMEASVESAEVVIVGGGPHALAALAALTEDSKEGTTVCVIDPGSHFMQSWNTRFRALEIKHLRSPAFVHPMAFEPTALVEFATREGRTSELSEPPVSGTWLASTDIGQDALLKACPSQALFQDYCATLEARLPHRWLCATATSVSKDASTGEFRVHCRATVDQRERTVAARAVILATGPVGHWNIPPPFGPHLASGLVLHTEQLLGENKGTLSEEIARSCPNDSARVLVIGGGISAAQAALAAYRAGHQVVLRSRRPLTTAPFDVGVEWFDMRTADRMRFEFLCLPVKARGVAVRAATPGGSVPEYYLEQIRSISQASSALQLEVDEAIDSSNVSLSQHGGLIVNGESFAMVIAATGVTTAPTCSPLYQSVKEVLKAPTVGDMPRVDNRLRWVPGEDLFVLGANATLELGPGGGNLMGAMRGARVVSNQLHGLMGKSDRSSNSGSSTCSNQYTCLGDRVRFGDGDEAEIDFLAQQLHLTPQAETALRKGRSVKGGRKQIVRATPYLDGALKGNLKGQEDAISHLTVRTRWATYW
jgi:hypothetical protein